MDKPFKIRLLNSDRFGHASGQSDVYIAINEGLTKMDLSRQLLHVLL